VTPQVHAHAEQGVLCAAVFALVLLQPAPRVVRHGDAHRARCCSVCLCSCSVRSQVDAKLASAAEEEVRALRRSDKMDSGERPSQQDALNKAIPEVLRADGFRQPTLLWSEMDSMLRAMYVEQIGYNAAPDELSLPDIADVSKLYPKAGTLRWVDPGSATDSRPHRGYELVLQPYMQALEASPRAHVHLRSVVFGIEQIEPEGSGGMALQPHAEAAAQARPRRVVRFHTAPTPLSYMEDALMAQDLASAGPAAHAGLSTPAAAGSFAAAMPSVLSEEEQRGSAVHEFDFLVCTVPMPVLAEQQPSVFTEQALTAAQWSAVRNLARVPGAELRCFLAFRNALIRTANEHREGLDEQVPAVVHTAMLDDRDGSVVEPWRFFVYPDRQQQDSLTTPPYGQILVGSLQPALIPNSLSWSTQRLAEHALDQLRQMFTTEVVARADFSGALSSHWLRDPFSRCAYVAIHKHCSVDDVTELAPRQDEDSSIFFAGEATAPLRHLQQVAGAQLSGEIAAQALMSVPHTSGTQLRTTVAGQSALHSGDSSRMQLTMFMCLFLLSYCCCCCCCLHCSQLCGYRVRVEFAVAARGEAH